MKYTFHFCGIVGKGVWHHAMKNLEVDDKLPMELYKRLKKLAREATEVGVSKLTLQGYPSKEFWPRNTKDETIELFRTRLEYAEMYIIDWLTSPYHVSMYYFGNVFTLSVHALVRPLRRNYVVQNESKEN